MQTALLLNIRQIYENSIQQPVMKWQETTEEQGRLGQSTENKIEPHSSERYSIGNNGALCLQTSVRQRRVGYCRCRCHHSNILSIASHYASFDPLRAMREAQLTLNAVDDKGQQPWQSFEQNMKTPDSKRTRGKSSTAKQKLRSSGRCYEKQGRDTIRGARAIAWRPLLTRHPVMVVLMNDMGICSVRY